MLAEDEAIARAAAFLAEQVPGDDLRVAHEHAVTDKGRLIIPYDAIGYLDDGDEDAQLSGNDPITVDLETGATEFLDFEEFIALRKQGKFGGSVRQ